MSEQIIPNVVVSMPSQLFTLARKFQAASNGKIFIGKINTDPTIPENQIQVYLENEDGTTVPVSQPLIINQAGYPVYNGQIAKFVTVQGHSMAVYDSYGAQQFYYPNVLKYDPDQFSVWAKNNFELSGYTKVDPKDFASGAILTSEDQALFFASDGNYYTWHGDLPKFVPAGSTPESAGGVGMGAWVSVGYGSLRRDLKVGDGSLIGLGHGTLKDSLYYVTPEQFASEMNGYDDWAIAINAALNYMESIGGGIVQLKPKTYFHRTQILIPGNCTLRGSGKFSSVISAYDDMPAELNSITSKNNPMYSKKADGVDKSLEKFEYIEGVNIESLSVHANATGRFKDIKNISWYQSCGIKLTSVKRSSIKHCFVHDAIVHCYDVAASAYFDNGNPKDNISGGSYDVLIEDCEGLNSFKDDVFTTHNSDKILIKNCIASNDGANPYMTWDNNQHGFEIDEGSTNVTVVDCKATGFIAGFQVKGHDTTFPASHVKLVRCHAKDCRFSFMVTQYSKNKGILGRNVSIIDCTSENPHHDKNKKYSNELILAGDQAMRPRHVWNFGYTGFSIRNLIITGGEGLIEFGHSGASTPSIDIQGVRSYAGYSGIYKGSDVFGLINFITDQTEGVHSVKDVYVYDPISNPVVRCIDSKLINKLHIHNIVAKGTGENPCVMANLDTDSNISGIQSSGFLCAFRDKSVTTLTGDYNNDVFFTVTNGSAHLVTRSVPTVTIFPARKGNTAINKSSGIYYTAKSGEWVPANP